MSTELSRRNLLKTAAFWPLARFAAAQNRDPVVQRVLPGLRIDRNAVNTVVLERNGRKLVIDCGEFTDTSGVDWLLLTHHHRDVWWSAPLFGAAGVNIGVPEKERGFFEDAEGFWSRADQILDHRYDFRPHLLTGVRSVPVRVGLQGGDRFDWQDLRIEILDTPGHTDGCLTYLVDWDGTRVAFTGDLIYDTGQILELYSLQKRFPGMRGDYWGFGGAVEEVIKSLQLVLQAKPDLIIPSHGEVMDRPQEAVKTLIRSLDHVMQNYLRTAAWRIYFPGISPTEPPMLEPLAEVGYPPWIRDIASTTKAIVAADGSVFLSDCGSPRAIQELARLQSEGRFKKIEGIWITHYHDDHTQQVNLVRKRFGARVYAQQELVDILENPKAYQMPCLFPESIRVDHVLQDGQSFQWKEFRLTAFHFPGQTLHHSGLLVEKEGFRVFFTGDSFANWGVDDYCSQNRCFLGPGIGYHKCFQILLETRPNILVAAHWGPLPISREAVARTAELFIQREELYRGLFPYENINFGLDPGWLRIYPYRHTALSGSRFELEMRVWNHSDRSLKVAVEPHLPDGWSSDASRYEEDVLPKREGRLRMRLAAPSDSGGRHVLVFSVVANGRRLGPICESIVDILGG